MFHLPVGQLVRRVLDSHEEVASVQVAQSGRLIRAAVPITSNSQPGGIDGVVVVNTYVSESILAKMQGIAKHYTDYRQMRRWKIPLRPGPICLLRSSRFYCYSALPGLDFTWREASPCRFRNWLKGTEAVARGDLNVRIRVNATDEIGDVDRLVNRMTEDLSNGKVRLEEANQSLMQSNVEVDRRRAYTEAVVDTIASGVMSIDTQHTITTFNHSAERILGVRGRRCPQALGVDVFKFHQFPLFQEAYDRIFTRSPG